MNQVLRHRSRKGDEFEPAWDIAYLFPSQGSWTEEEYLALDGNYLVEFDNGSIEVLPMPTTSHQLIVMYLHGLLHAFVSRRGLGTALFAALRVRLWSGKFREPDLLLLLSAADSRRQNRFWEGADLALEVVSEEKPERDLVDKRGDYAEAKVPEYWIVSPQNETITVLQLRGDVYEEAGCYRRGELAHSVLRPEFSIAVGAVFDAAGSK